VEALAAVGGQVDVVGDCGLEDASCQEQLGHRGEEHGEVSVLLARIKPNVGAWDGAMGSSIGGAGGERSDKASSFERGHGQKRKLTSTLR